MNIQGLHPGITAPLQAQTANGASAKSNATGASTNASGSTSTGSSTSALGPSSSSLQETFLNLLVTELQNQDPTAPVDPTEMVGQLVSLNQLDQLISINSTLQGLVPSTSTPSSTAQAVAADPLGATGATSTNPSSAASAALDQLQPAATGTQGPSALMNLYGSFGAPAQSTILTHTGGR
jgi:flagellar basal-body rod modification protein FlgD